MDRVKRDHLLEKLTKATLATIEANKPTGPGRACTHDEKIVILASKVGGCKNTELLALIEAMLERELPKDMKIPTDEPRAQLFVGAVVVPITNQNSHNYPIGEPCMVTHGDYAMCLSGSEGNLLPTHEWGLQLRAATLDEISWFVDEAGDSIIKSGRIV